MYSGFRNPTPDNPVPCGRYELLERIGYGGMAEVFRARLTGPSGFSKTVVIKRILPRLANDNLVVRMFIEEAKIAAAADHENIATVFELGVADDGKFFMVMEYIQGIDLELLIGSAAKRSLRMPPWLAIHTVAEILEALSYVHNLTDDEGQPRNVIHRDATPSNIFLSNLGQVKLSDFGVADYEGKSPTTQAGQLKGKLAYMSPEQLNNRALDRRADLFTIGVVLWEAITHQRLFGAMTEVQAMMAICDGKRRKPSEVARDIPPGLDEIALKALHVDPAERYASAEELQSDLLAILHDMRGPVRRSEVREVVRVLTGREAPSEETSGSMLSLSPRAKSSFMMRIDEPQEVVPGVPLADTYIRPVDPDSQESGDLIQTLDESHQIGLVDEVAELRAMVSEQTAAVYDDPLDQTLRDETGSLAPIGATPSIVDSTPPIVDPAEPLVFSFFVRRHGRPSSSAMPWSEANATLANFAENGVRASISADDKYWIDAEEFARLTSQDLIVEPETPPTNVTVVGSAAQRRIPAVFSILSRDRATGTLAVAKTTPGTEEWYEIHLVNGQPSRLKTNVPSMQLPALLASQGWVPADRLAELLHAVVTERKPLEQVARARGFAIPSTLEVARARATALFGWGEADYTFNVDINGELEVPFARSILSLLPTLVMRSLTSAQVFERMMPRLDVVHETSWRFGEAIDEMELDDDDRAAAECFERRHSIRQIIEARIEDRDRMLRMALLLIEADLLLDVID